MAEIVWDRYKNKKKDAKSLYNLYLSGFDGGKKRDSWKEEREAYPAWREKQQAADAAKQERKLRETPPQKTCPRCGAPLDSSGKCPKCGGFYQYDNSRGEWVWQEYLSGEFIAERVQQFFQEKEAVG
jgi:hypothetical protein